MAAWWTLRQLEVPSVPVTGNWNRTIARNHTLPAVPSDTCATPASIGARANEGATWDSNGILAELAIVWIPMHLAFISKEGCFRRLGLTAPVDDRWKPFSTKLALEGLRYSFAAWIRCEYDPPLVR